MISLCKFSDLHSIVRSTTAPMFCPEEIPAWEKECRNEKQQKLMAVIILRTFIVIKSCFMGFRDPIQRVILWFKFFTL